MRTLKENTTREPMIQCSTGEVPASPEMHPLNLRESPGSTTPTTPTSAISTDMNIHAVTKLTTTGPSTGTGDGQMVKPKPVLVDTRMPRGRVWQAEPEQQLQPQAQPDGKVRGQVGNETRAWDLATSSSDSAVWRRTRRILQTVPRNLLVSARGRTQTMASAHRESGQ